MFKLPYYKEYNPASENEEESNLPEWRQKVTLPLKPDLYRTTQPVREPLSGDVNSREDDTTIDFTHYQALYMFYLAMDSFGISPSQYKTFADGIAAGTIVEPVYDTKEHHYYE
jgi:hypothetical protein